MSPKSRITRRMGHWVVVFQGSEGKVAVNRGKLRTWPESLVQKPTGPDEVRLVKSPRHGADFLRAVRTRENPVCDVEIGHRTMTVCHLGNIAYLLKRPLKWDPVKEEFNGDEQANRLRDRARREPWRLA